LRSGHIQCAWMGDLLPTRGDSGCWGNYLFPLPSWKVGEWGGSLHRLPVWYLPAQNWEAHTGFLPGVPAGVFQ